MNTTRILNCLKNYIKQIINVLKIRHKYIKNMKITKIKKGKGRNSPHIWGIALIYSSKTLEIIIGISVSYFNSV